MTSSPDAAGSRPDVGGAGSNTEGSSSWVGKNAPPDQMIFETITPNFQLGEDSNSRGAFAKTTPPSQHECNCDCLDAHPRCPRRREGHP